MGEKYEISGRATIGDTNIVNGQAGAVGRNPRSQQDVFSQVLSKELPDSRLGDLADQLNIVRAMIKEQALARPTAEQDQEIGHAAQAEIAARNGDRDTVVAGLRKTGEWMLAVAKDTGTEIVARLLAALIVR